MEQLEALKGVGQVRMKAFARLGLFTVEDLLYYYPADYQDRTSCHLVRDLLPGQTTCVWGMVAEPPKETAIRQGLSLTKVTVVDDTGRLHLTFFNAPYVRTALVMGESYVFFGKVEVKLNRFEMVNPVFESEQRVGHVTGRMMPIYRLTHGLPQYVVRMAVEQAVELLAENVPDVMPAQVRRDYHLCDIGFALRHIHAPKDADSLQLARRRLAFEELFLLSLGLSWLKRGREVQSGISFAPLDWAAFEAPLAFTLTGAQRRVIQECEHDLTTGRLMSRLIQGDVGSGKTIAAAALCLMAVRSGYQAVLMAPTELLASQHYATLAPFMKIWGVSCGLLTGKLTPKAKKAVHAQLAEGSLSFVIGTHALLSKQVSFAKLALIVTDEQHRFGVQQRSTLAAKAESSGIPPHTLVMSATPIPRTLALLLYGELDVSILDELPPGRQPVKTFVVGEPMRPRIDGFILKTVTQGGQVYIVCPLIERLDEEGKQVSEGLQEAVAVQARLQKLFPQFEIGLAHGRLKVKERGAVMERFKSGELPILVATTVIEVGVDVPNASLMVVENADRFGLAQLHQLRGRVGRGRRESFCVLFESVGGEVSHKRLKLLEKSNDGFAIAEADLSLRGPGEFFGTRQHGVPTLRVADLSADTELLVEARQAALDVLEEDSALEAPGLSALRSHMDALICQLGE